MMSRRRKALLFIAAIVAFAVALLLGALLFLSTGQPWGAAFWALVWGIAVGTTTWGFIGFMKETDPALTLGRAFAVVPPPSTPLPPETDRKDPWPAQWLAPALATAFAGTPYVVRTDGHSVLVHADLADVRWQHVATIHHLQHAFVARFTPTERPGVIRRTDESRRLEAQAGVTHLGAQLAVASGRQWGYTRRVEYGLGLDGFKKRVDYEFSTSEINQPVQAIMSRAGWRATLDAESRGALVMGAMGLSALVVVPVGLLVKNLAS